MGNRINDAEEWRAVVGYEGYYEVSNQGRVRSLDRWSDNRWGTKTFRRGRILKPVEHHSGYRPVTLKLPGDNQVQRNIHVLVLAAFVGPCPAGMQSCHNNGDRADNRLQNLRYDTVVANNLDKLRHGTQPYPQRGRTACINGHPYEPGSYRVLSNGTKFCRVCDREARWTENSLPTIGRNECKYGHPLDGLTKDGKRFCKACQRAAGRRSYWRKKEEKLRTENAA